MSHELNNDGVWKFEENDKWKDFDSAASKQIDDELTRQWHDGQSTIQFEMKEGPWFSQDKNKGVYMCKIQLNSNKSKITSVMQHNTKTGFCRKMTRDPLFFLGPFTFKNGN